MDRAVAGAAGAASPGPEVPLLHDQTCILQPAFQRSAICGTFLEGFRSAVQFELVNQPERARRAEAFQNVQLAAGAVDHYMQRSGDLSGIGQEPCHRKPAHLVAGGFP